MQPSTIRRKVRQTHVDILIGKSIFVLGCHTVYSFTWATGFRWYGKISHMLMVHGRKTLCDCSLIKLSVTLNHSSCFPSNPSTLQGLIFPWHQDQHLEPLSIAPCPLSHKQVNILIKAEHIQRLNLKCGNSVQIHWSGITSWPLTGEGNNIDCLFIMAPVSGIYKAASEHFVLKIEVLEENGRAYGLERVWEGPNC